ncbi:MAG: hypothetical protein QOG23_2408 [Blastocatellia bacterium]|nr:hypothetical protein [Blastocatellia bacterium]
MQLWRASSQRFSEVIILCYLYLGSDVLQEDLLSSSRVSTIRILAGNRKRFWPKSICLSASSRASVTRSLNRSRNREGQSQISLKTIAGELAAKLLGGLWTQESLGCHGSRWLNSQIAVRGRLTNDLLLFGHYRRSAITLRSFARNSLCLPKGGLE